MERVRILYGVSLFLSSHTYIRTFRGLFNYPYCYTTTRRQVYNYRVTTYEPNFFLLVSVICVTGPPVAAPSPLWDETKLAVLLRMYVHKAVVTGNVPNRHERYSIYHIYMYVCM